MFGLRSARSRAIAAGALGLLLLAGVATTAAADRAAGTTLWLLIGLSAAALVVAAATVVGIIVSVVRPLEALRATARAITAGDPQARAKVSGPQEVASLARDITERKRAEEARRQAEQRYRDLFEGAPVMYVITRNQEGVPVVADCNELFLSTLGYARPEVLERPLADFYTAESRAELLEGGGYQRALKGHFAAEERQLLARDGRVVQTLLRALPETDAGGNVFGTRAMYVDITERKRAEEALRESEQRFRTLSEATFEGIAIHKKGKILDANQTLAMMFGYELSEVIGMHPSDFVAPESRDLLAYATLSRYEKPFELIGLRKDGSIFPIEACGKATLYRGRMVTVAAIRDITQRKRAEEALRAAREDIESRVERHMQQVNGYGLTFRELAVLHLVAGGESDKGIAAVLGISSLTAHKHLANILEKMGAVSRTEAGVRALREGLLD